jgi:uncharacterized protein
MTDGIQNTKHIIMYLESGFLVFLWHVASSLITTTSWALAETSFGEMRILRPLLSFAFSTSGSGRMSQELRGSDATASEILSSTTRIALVGASNKEVRPSNYVMKFLLENGYNVIPVNPGLEGQQIHGQTVVGSLKDIKEPVDMIDIFRASDAVGPIVDDAIDMKAKFVWMQMGVVNNEAAQKAIDAGLLVVMDRCPKVEIPRLGIDGPTKRGKL